MSCQYCSCEIGVKYEIRFPGQCVFCLTETLPTRRNVTYLGRFSNDHRFSLDQGIICPTCGRPLKEVSFPCGNGILVGIMGIDITQEIEAIRKKVDAVRC